MIPLPVPEIACLSVLLCANVSKCTICPVQLFFYGVRHASQASGFSAVPWLMLHGAQNAIVEELGTLSFDLENEIERNTAAIAIHGQ